MSFVKEIYNNKAIIGARDDFDSLIGIMQSNDPSIQVTDNYDRTLLVTFNDPANASKFEEIFAKSLETWLDKCPVTCPIKYVYNLLPLNSTQFILRI